MLNAIHLIRSSSLAVLSLVATGARAQNCSITLLSDSSSLEQVWCLDPPIATIKPIVFLVEGTGVQVASLPPGVTADLSNDTLTLSGTITSQGFHNAQVTTSEGCISQNMAMYMSVIVDPGFFCTVAGSDVILHWPGMNAPLEIGGEQILLSCTSDDGFVDVLDLPLPGPDSVVWSGLPVNTVLTFGLTRIRRHHRPRSCHHRSLRNLLHLR